MTSNVNPLYDPSTDNQVIPQDTQKMLNTPQAGGQLADEDKVFLAKIMKLVGDGTINLYQPGTLLNMPVYEGLAQEAKAKADLNCVTMLAKIREIVDLEKAPMDTYMQEGNLVQGLRLSKERLEEFGGDIFII